jgi:hypothetical protein
VKETKLEIGALCHLVKTEYTDIDRYITLEYTERAYSYSREDDETEIEIEEEKAVEIIKFLQDSFGINEEVQGG